MKQIVNSIIISCVLFLSMTSCEKDLPLYDTPDCWLNFVYYNTYTGSILKREEVTDEMRKTSYSFVYVDEDVEVDTLWFKVGTMGFVADENRPFELEQVLTGKNDAKPDEHYVAFTNEELRVKYYFIPAGEVETRIPVVVKRAPSLSGGDVNLQFTFKDNDYFKPGYLGLTVRTLSISVQLAKPFAWEEYGCDYIFGVYGPEKHRLMINWTGKKWDEEYIKGLMKGDSAYVDYLEDWFVRKLEEENAKLVEAGKKPYEEADGTPVSFEPMS